MENAGGDASPRSFGEMLHRAHTLDFGVRVAYALWTLASAMGSLVARYYGQLGFGTTLLVAIGLAILGTQIPNISHWTRGNVSLGKLTSVKPWLVVVSAIGLVVFVYAADFLTGSKPESSSSALPADKDHLAIEASDLTARLRSLEITLNDTLKKLGDANAKIAELQTALAEKTSGLAAVRQPTAQPPEEGQQPRVFVDVDLINKIMERLHGKMTTEQDQMTKPYIGKWIRLDMPIDDVSLAVTHGTIQGRIGEPQSHVCYCNFDAKWQPRLEILARNEMVKLVGKIQQILTVSLYLNECEIE
jgi:hypothetical protein